MPKLIKNIKKKVVVFNFQFQAYANKKCSSNIVFFTFLKWLICATR